ncbi:Uncharacterised protein [Staphylococcus aureus]|nr:Uncharacterised protein [Staphylococcus aureus]
MQAIYYLKKRKTIFLKLVFSDGTNPALNIQEKSNYFTG